ncbi:MAG: GNAT family N-acetyltransferase [Pseudomonadota bacterium]
MDSAASNAPEIWIEAGLRPEHRAAAASGYWEAFARKLRYPLGPREKAVRFIERVLDPSHSISAVALNGDFLGVAGFKTPQGEFVGGNFADLRAVYGRLGAIGRVALVSVLERDCEDGTLLMDGIFVDAKARGFGVGTKLLSALQKRARDEGFKRLRLDVIDTNPRARALYEREGFMPRDSSLTGLLRPIYGFASSTTMMKDLTL